MKNHLLFCIAVVMIALVGCTTPSTTENDESSSPTSIAKDGSEVAKLYEQKCSSCHGENLEGRIGPELTKVGERLSVDQIETIINEGAPAMPGDLIADDQAKRVAEWLMDTQ